MNHPIHWLRALQAASILLLCMPATSGFYGSLVAASSMGQTQFGIQIDGPNRIVPSDAQVRALGATWERSVVGTRSMSRSRRRDDWCRNGKASLKRVFSASARWLMTFNNQSCSYDAPLDPGASAKQWYRYLKRHYLPGLRAFMNHNAQTLVVKGRDATFEIWNEENCAANGSYIPPAIYASMLVRAARVIRTWNVSHGAHVQTIMGGLCDPKGETEHNSNYVQTVLQTGGSGLRTVRAIGIHPSYGTVEPAVWRSEISFFRRLIREHASSTGHHQVWVTEAGSTGELGGRRAQATFLTLLLTTLEDDRIPVVIWYGFDDGILGRGGYGGWGLYDKCGVLKPAGAAFAQIAYHLPKRPPAGSTVHVKIVRLHTKWRRLHVTINVGVSCPSGSETPWRKVTLTDTYTPVRGRPATARWSSPYHTGGSRFRIVLNPGRHSFVGGYQGDYQLEGGSSKRVSYSVARYRPASIRRR